MSIYTLSFIGTAPLGSLAVGFVGEHVSPRVAVVGCACFALVCAILLLTRLPLLARAQAEREALLEGSTEETIAPRTQASR
jgi:predicted MFS family arabinose efflux permease